MRYALFLLAIISVPANGDEWSPPENPDPSVILDEAHDDFRAKQYEVALAKHVWFYHNALSIQPSLYGVRLSFALMYWHELAKKYPPALTKLEELRDQAREDVLEEKNTYGSFHDMKSINDELSKQSSTKDFFVLLDQESPEIAKLVFDLAQPSLVLTKAYSLYGKYVSPKDDFAQIRQAYIRDKELSEDPRIGKSHLDYAHMRFANATTTLVAILALNDCEKESKEIADSSRLEWDDTTFHSALDKAMKGVVPDPWP